MSHGVESEGDELNMHRALFDDEEKPKSSWLSLIAKNSALCISVHFKCGIRARSVFYEGFSFTANRSEVKPADIDYSGTGSVNRCSEDP